MALSGITNTVDTLHNCVHRRVITDGAVRTIEVIIYRTWQTDATEIKLLCKHHRTRQRAITTNDNQRINTLLNKVIVCLLATFHRFKTF